MLTFHVTYFRVDAIARSRSVVTPRLQVDNITVTKKTFNLLFRGTELVVAGKLKDTKSEFNGALDADSTEGSFQRPVLVTCFDIPIVIPTAVPETRKIGNWYFLVVCTRLAGTSDFETTDGLHISMLTGHLEKLWAYLYIQQLMDQYELNKNENSTEKAKALELALKVSRAQNHVDHPRARCH